MAGLAAVFRPDGGDPRDGVERILPTLDYRGSGESRVRSLGSCAVGFQHRRPATGADGGRTNGNGSGRPRGTQPIRRGNLLVAFDGRIDNREAVAARASRAPPGSAGSTASGGDPAARSDAALVADLYRSLGTGAVEAITGPFALVVFDAKTDRLLVARDGTGLRHVYYGTCGDAVVVGSEVRTVLAHGAVPATVDGAAAARYVRRGIVPHDPTFHRRVHRLPPGSTLSVTGDDRTVERHWTPSVDPALADRSGAELARRFRAVVARAVRRRLRDPAGDGPGVAMSGGLDSTAVAALAADADPAGGDRPRDGDRTPVPAFSAVFDRRDAIDEETGVRAMEAAGPVAVHRIPGDDLWPLRDEVVYDRVLRNHPCADTSLALYDAVCRRAAGEGIGTVLTGLGGNLCDGSRLFYADRLRESPVETLRRAADDPMSTFAILFFYGLLPALPGNESTAAYLRSLDGAETVPLPSVDAGDDPGAFDGTESDPSAVGGTTHDSTPDVGTAVGRPTDGGRAGVVDHPDPYSGPYEGTERSALVARLWDPYVDLARDGARQTALARGVELRHPFLDPDVVEFLVSLPPGTRLSGGRHKALFRRAFRADLPAAVRSQSVSDNAYDGLVAEGLRRRRRAIRSRFEDPALADLLPVDPAAPAEALEAHFEDRLSATAAWRLVTTELWLSEEWTGAGAR